MRVIVPKNQYEYALCCCRATNNEVGGLFTCQITGEAEFTIDEFYLLPQEVTGGSIDFKGEDLSELIERLAKENKIQNLRGSWHSHVNMSVFYSTTDEDAIKKYRKNNPDLPWLVSLVLNKKGKVLPRVDIFDSETHPHIIFQENVEFEIDPPIDISDEIREKAKEDVNKVSKEVKWWKRPVNYNSKNKSVHYIDNLYSKPIKDLTDEEWAEVMSDLPS